MNGFTLPTSRPITQAYGAEFDDWDGDGIADYPGGFYHSIGWDGHNGIDYGCYEGDPVEAVADGVVTWAGWAGNHWLLSGGGIAVLIEHRGVGVQTEYLHLSRTDLNPGDRVSMGQVIGYSGSTGSSTAPHLHLGMLPLTGINLNNRMRGRIDPTPYLYGSGIAAMGGTITPLAQEDELSAAEVDRLINETQAQADVTRQYLADRVRDAALAMLNGSQAQQDVTRDYLANTTQAQSDVTRQYLNDRIRESSPADLAGQINAAGIAAQVRDELVKLIGGNK